MLHRCLVAGLQSTPMGCGVPVGPLSETNVEHRMCQASSAQAHGPWNPGLSSHLPPHVLPLTTIFRPDNTTTGLAEAFELSAVCGLPAQTLVALRPERLIMHELLIRITADLVVSDGSNVEDLGINFRKIAGLILGQYLTPHVEEISRVLEDFQRQAEALISAELESTIFQKPTTETKSEPSQSHWLDRLRPRFARRTRPQSTLSNRSHVDNGLDQWQRILADWTSKAASAQDPMHTACYEALVKIVSALIGVRGRVVGDQALITKLALTLVSNDRGSIVVGQAIEPWIMEAVRKEGFQLLASQPEPVVMNVKGAPASGKSTMRPRQKALARKLHIPWETFALISPDIWRKQLLDYNSLGPAYKYAGMLTALEVEMIDKKLDRYMADKAAQGRIPNLLIDRFRFDSFVPPTESDEASKLMTRFGAIIYMFFMITPPAATVERAWARGLEVGRYKAVDDILDHNIEAYTGMPDLFFTWALKTNKRVHFEFLDNDVPQRHSPRTVAFGWNGHMNILDVKRMLDIERFRKIDISATQPEDVYRPESLSAEGNTGFLQQCARMIPVIRLAEFQTGRVYARIEQGRLVDWDQTALGRAMMDADTATGLHALGVPNELPEMEGASPHTYLAGTQTSTVGAWGPTAR